MNNFEKIKAKNLDELAENEILDTDEQMHEYQDWQADYAETQAEWYQYNI